MRAPSARGGAAPMPIPQVPLLEATDLPDDGWSLPEAFRRDDDFGDDDRYAKLNVARSFDD